jgi:hypothetical protein
MTFCGGSSAAFGRCAPAPTGLEWEIGHPPAGGGASPAPEVSTSRGGGAASPLPSGAWSQVRRVRTRAGLGSRLATATVLASLATLE